VKTIVIVNPQSVNVRTEKIWQQLESELEQSIGSFQLMQTDRWDGATDLSCMILNKMFQG